jgi:hypothetical protein
MAMRQHANREETMEKAPWILDKFTKHLNRLGKLYLFRKKRDIYTPLTHEFLLSVVVIARLVKYREGLST